MPTHRVCKVCEKSKLVRAPGSRAPALRLLGVETLLNPKSRRITEHWNAGSAGRVVGAYSWGRVAFSSSRCRPPTSDYRAKFRGNKPHFFTSCEYSHPNVVASRRFGCSGPGEAVMYRRLPLPGLRRDVFPISGRRNELIHRVGGSTRTAAANITSTIELLNLSRQRLGSAVGDLKQFRKRRRMAAVD